ncbi:MAG: bifunctional phosphopantothenoylcysteine decarboxylase/phosphopantothenate--cysteine ligase CoaBC [Candidatus Binatia bacterium]
MGLLGSKRVLLGIGGGIAAYKCPELVRRLLDEGAEVQVAMTRAAREFVSPLVLQTLSKRRVALDLLDSEEEAVIGHIRLAEEADVVLVAPATADLIARMAVGVADDILTAALLVARCPVVVAPSMNTNMLGHPTVVRNLETLRAFGHRIVDSDRGDLACGYEGAGRLPDAPDLIAEVAAALAPRDLAGKRILVSAGPTREALDPVRYLTNRSSGRMGYAVASAAWRRGAEVTLVSGPTALPCPRGVRRVDVTSAAEMHTAMLERAPQSDVVVMVAAVADYRPAAMAAEKIKKKQGQGLALELAENDDILAALGRLPGSRVLVGFAAETTDVVRHAREKLERKKAHLIVANDVTLPGAGFESLTNAAVLVDPRGDFATGLLSKDALADCILDRVLELTVR